MRSRSELVRSRSIPTHGKFSEQFVLLTYFSLRSLNSPRQGCIRNSSEIHCGRVDRIPTPESRRSHPPAVKPQRIHDRFPAAPDAAPQEPSGSKSARRARPVLRSKWSRTPAPATSSCQVLRDHESVLLRPRHGRKPHIVAEFARSPIRSVHQPQRMKDAGELATSFSQIYIAHLEAPVRRSQVASFGETG
jgi:hypothetical protein